MVPPGNSARMAAMGVDALAQQTAHVGDDVVHMGIALDRHVLIDAHRAADADAAEIVALQIDEHHVLRALLLVAEQGCRSAPHPARARRRAVECRRWGASRRCRRERDSRRSGEELITAKSPVAHERCERTRVGGAQPSVQRRRIDARAAASLPAPRQVGLIHIAGGDVLERACDRLQKPPRLLLAHLDARRLGIGRPPARDAHPARSARASARSRAPRRPSARPLRRSRIQAAGARIASAASGSALGGSRNRGSISSANS